MKQRGITIAFGLCFALAMFAAANGQIGPAPGGGTSFANPSASVGTVAVNGVATTAMRSDGAPAIDLTMTPTWSGLHTFGAGWTATAPVRTTIAGTTTTATINNTSTGNITVGSTTGWPSPGVLKVDTQFGFTPQLELMTYTVVDATTLNITARGAFGTTAQAKGASAVTLSFALRLEAASTSAFPLTSSWSDGKQYINSGAVGAGLAYVAWPTTTSQIYFVLSANGPQAVNGNAVLNVNSGDVSANTPIRTQGYTVSGLPAGTVGARAYVTDQLTACPAAGAALTGGGAVVCPVFRNATVWVGG